MKSGKIVLAMAGALAVAGCQGGMKSVNLFGTAARPATAAAAAEPAKAGAQDTGSVKLVAHDVEAPAVFDVSAKALWDGRPSLGGVWVAYPGVENPERVIIRNPANGRFVIGALFRREINGPGPKLQMSSDAATALGLAAGQPATITVTALRRVQGNQPAPEAAKPTVTGTGKIAAKPVAAVKAEAGAAIDKAAKAKAEAKAPSPRPERPATAPAKAAPASRRFVQIGIFSVEANARRADRMITKTGAKVEVKPETTNGKTFWRVLAGPADTAAQQKALLDQVKAAGFGDAFLVKK